MGNAASVPLTGIVRLDDERIKHMEGDVTYLEYEVKRWFAPPVIGFFGTDALTEFDTKLADGSIRRADAFPAGLVALLGPNVLPTLDGAEYASRFALLRQALCDLPLVPRLRQHVHDEHAKWAAHGGAISLAANSAKLVFRVFCALVLGLESVDLATYELVTTFQAALHKGEARGKPDAAAIAARARVIDALVAPAIKQSQARAADQIPHGAAIDVLVASTSPAADLEADLLFLLVTTLPRLERVVVNSITGFCMFSPTVHAPLVAARDALEESHPTADARWAALASPAMDTNYIHYYLQEVTRYYAAGPSHVYGRAVSNLRFSGNIEVKKGSLTVAVLDAPLLHATDFDPMRFENLGNVDLFPRSVDEAFIRLVARGAFVSLVDYHWRMAPLQDYSVLNAQHVPIGQLMAVGFRDRTDKTKLLCDVAGSEAEWKFLQLPDANQYRGEVESVHAMFTDIRLDVWSHLMLRLVETKFWLWKRPTAAHDLTIPKVQKPLKKLTLYGTKIQIPTEDEDLSLDPWVQIKTFEFVRDQCPFTDDFDTMWAPNEDMEAYVMGKVGKMWPPIGVHWNDRYSDRALSLMAFHGMGQHLVAKLPQPHADGSYYGLLLNFMAQLEVRPGFATYGADAFFDQQGNVVKIVRQNATYVPGDDQWEYIKFAFRCSLIVRVTAVDHLLGIHITVANYLTTATREQLPPAHPLRRLLKPFTFRSVVVNHEAAWSLFYPQGLLHRASALTEKGMQQTWDYGLANFKFETLPEHLARQQIDTVAMPFEQDGLAFFSLVRRFVSDYVDLYYASDADVTGDASLVQFWAALVKTLPCGLPRPLTLDSVKDIVTQGIVWVTAIHNHVGSVGEYKTDPAFCTYAWVEGELCARPKTAAICGILAASTNVPNPSILEDFSHVMLDDKAKALCHRFTDDLQAFSTEIQARNAKRDQPYVSFDPATIDLSVSF
ncbi:Aste57867_15221 [Aphanomyces stellatus]|uniref:Aste57867_15221 protein n=1 Tax=Aphanomyces stellatus TaxID=120398 RepID=A0A485L2M8_9STRA|nr:hypothetical protein As57867_015165 [Aphanomyces stellatus]VFT92030.1 Aste57867_15221 [Aphanomyces stellatus]